MKVFTFEGSQNGLKVVLQDVVGVETRNDRYTEGVVLSVTLQGGAELIAFYFYPEDADKDLVKFDEEMEKAERNGGINAIGFMSPEIEEVEDDSQERL